MAPSSGLTRTRPGAAMGTSKEVAARIAVRCAADAHQRHPRRPAGTCRHVRGRAEAVAGRHTPSRGMMNATAARVFKSARGAPGLRFGAHAVTASA